MDIVDPVGVTMFLVLMALGHEDGGDVPFGAWLGMS